MDDALRIISEMYHSIWSLLKNTLDDLQDDEIDWRRHMEKRLRLRVRCICWAIIRRCMWRCTAGRFARSEIFIARHVESQPGSLPTTRRTQDRSFVVLVALVSLVRNRSFALFQQRRLAFLTKSTKTTKATTSLPSRIHVRFGGRLCWMWY